MNKRPGCLPTAQQELLLQASLLQGRAACNAWSQWLHEGNIENLDEGSSRLLPLLYMNVGNLQPMPESWLCKLRNAYMLTRSENQALLHHAAQALDRLQRSGIKTLLLKGAPLAALYYKDLGLRPMSDLDVLVPTEKASESINVFSKLGWEPLFRAPHAQGFRSTAFGAAIDLHWHALLELSEANSDDEFWNGAHQAEIDGIPVFVLNPTDLLFHICVHGMKWEPVPTIRWIADAFIVLRSEETIDWHRLIHHGVKHRLTLPLKEALAYLKQLLDASIPSDVLTQLDAIPVSYSERLDYTSRTCLHPQRNTLLTLWAYYSEYRHWDKNQAESNNKLIGFPRFLRHLWGLSSIWQVPHYAFRGIMNRSFSLTKNQAERQSIHE